MSRIIILYFWFWVYICFLKIRKLFLDAYVVGPVFPKSSAFMVTELHSILRKTNHKSTTNRELELFSNFFLIAWVCSDGWRTYCYLDRYTIRWKHQYQITKYKYLPPWLMVLTFILKTNLEFETWLIFSNILDIWWQG